MPAILKLRIATNAEGDVFELVLKKSKYRVGRRFDNDLRIKETYVSAYHAEIHKDQAGNYTLVDTDSSNGTFVNGNRLTGSTPVPIHEGDSIKFGMLKVAVVKHVDTGPKVVALDHRDSATQAVAPTQPLKSTAPVQAPQPGTGAADKTGPFPPASSFSASTSKEAAILKDEGVDDVAQLTLKFAAVRKERDTLRREVADLQKKTRSLEQERKDQVSSLEREIREQKDQAEKVQKERKSSSETDAKEISRITGEFKNRETELQSEIARLKRDLDAVQKEAAKTKILEESNQRADEVVADLRNQLTELEEGNTESAQEMEKLSLELDRLRAENAELIDQLKDKAAEAATVAALAAKFEKNEHVALETGKTKARELEQQIAKLEGTIEKEQKRVEKESAAREKAEAELRDREAQFKDALQEKKDSEKTLRKELRRLESELKGETSKVAEASSTSEKLAEEIDKLKKQLSEAGELRDALEEEKEKSLSLEKELEREKAGQSRAKSEEVQAAELRISALESELEKKRKKAEAVARQVEKEKRGIEDRAAKKTAKLESKLLAAEQKKRREKGKENASQVRRITELESKVTELKSALREEKASLQSEENLKLSEAEESLSRAIHGREELAGKLSGTEQELASREELIAELQKKIGDLEFRLKSEKKGGHGQAGEISALRKELDSEKELRNKAEAAIEDAHEDIAQLRQSEKALKRDWGKETSEWEKKYKKLEDKVADATGQASTLADIQNSIAEATDEKSKLDGDLAGLKREIEKCQDRNLELESQHRELEEQRKFLETGLQITRAEVENVERRCQETRSKEEKLTLRIGAAEKRVQALRHLESELEAAIERGNSVEGKRASSFVSSDAVIADGSNGAASEEVFCRKLISKLDLLDDLTIRYGNKWRYPKVSEQLGILKNSFIDLLKEHSVAQFEVKPGAVLSLEERKRIKLIPPGELNRKKPLTKRKGRCGGSGDVDPGKVVETLRPGYIYQNAGNTIILRKAEVIVE